MKKSAGGNTPKKARTVRRAAAKPTARPKKTAVRKPAARKSRAPAAKRKSPKEKAAPKVSAVKAVTPIARAAATTRTRRKLARKPAKPRRAPVATPATAYPPYPSLPPAATLADLESQELPESYGTQELLIAPRDPHSLYVRWDVSPAQMRGYVAQSPEHQLALRVYADAGGEARVIESPVPSEARHCFVAVEPPGAKFTAELGYYEAEREWIVIAASAPVSTPRETPSQDRAARFVTFLPELTPGHTFEETDLWNPAAWAAGMPGIPEMTDAPWSEEHDDALADVIGPRKEIRQLEGSVESLHFSGGGEVGGEGGDLAFGSAPASSPAGGMPEGKPGGFWFRINAELIVYGATEPDATVTLGGQNIQLAPDGTFSCRFALPDGEHQITAIATSARGDLDGATLVVTRRTEPLGGSGEPQS